MADISQELEIINTATAGDDVRNALISAITKLNEEDLTSLQQLKTYLTTVTPLLNKFTVCPSGTLSITADGLHDVADYDMVNVDTGFKKLLYGTLSGSFIYSKPNLDLWMSVRRGLFENCTALSYVSINGPLYLGDYAFGKCPSLSTVILPTITYVGSSAFFSCSNLKSVSIPNAARIRYGAFDECVSLSQIEFNQATAIEQVAFMMCTSLESAFFLGSSVPILYASTVFHSTPMMDSSYLGRYGSIYVLPSMVDAFKSAENWSYYSNRITAYSEG